jgi:hypothetical protein
VAGPAYYTGQMNIAKNFDWVVSFIYTDDADAPIDLTGSVIKMEIRNFETDHTAVVSVHSPDDGIALPTPTNGKFEIMITRDMLARLSAGDYVADIVRLMSDGIQERIWEGPVTVVEGTTR